MGEKLGWEAKRREESLTVASVPPKSSMVLCVPGPRLGTTVERDGVDSVHIPVRGTACSIHRRGSRDGSL